MKVLDKCKLLDFMDKRKKSLYDHIVRDFGGGFGRVYEHGEVKYWKEAVERGEFDTELEAGIHFKLSDYLKEVYVILSAEHPEIADFTFYDDEEGVKERVAELNKLAKREEYWYITLYSNLRNKEEVR